MEKKFVPMLITLIITLSIIGFFMVMGLLYYANPGDALFAADTVETFIPFIPGPIFTDLLIILLAPIILFFVLFYSLAPYWAKLLIGIHKVLSKLGGNPK